MPACRRTATRAFCSVKSFLFHSPVLAFVPPGIFEALRHMYTAAGRRTGIRELSHCFLALFDARLLLACCSLSLRLVCPAARGAALHVRGWPAAAPKHARRPSRAEPLRLLLFACSLNMSSILPWLRRKFRSWRLVSSLWEKPLIWHPLAFLEPLHGSPVG